MSGTSVRGEDSKPSKLGRMSLNEFKAARLTCLGVDLPFPPHVGSPKRSASVDCFPTVGKTRSLGK